MKIVQDKWNNGDPYEYFMGRWSSLMSIKFLKWLNMSTNLNWLDVGCGTGALSAAIAHHSKPKKITGIDPSEHYTQKAKQRVAVPAAFIKGNAEQLPFQNQSFDVVVTGLALNFFPDINKALSEFKRVVQPTGTIAAYVWDYSGRMDFLRKFWDAAYQIDPQSAQHDEGLRFPICTTENLIALFQNAAFSEIETVKLDIDTIFKDFDDLWNPFMGIQGPAPSYLASLSTEQQLALKNAFKANLQFENDESIHLIARAIAIKGKSN
jgi:ubiquinone/menaquinone biosynthesis C-methylase UbiE